jgi:hypothetical protein
VLGDGELSGDEGAALLVVLPDCDADDGPADAPAAGSASVTPSVNGSPTRPAAPKPTPTAATAKATHSATRASRLSMPPSLSVRGLTGG